jgi:hypothetical protein
MTQPMSEWTRSIMANWKRWDRSVWVEITK